MRPVSGTFYIHNSVYIVHLTFTLWVGKSLYQAQGSDATDDKANLHAMHNSGVIRITLYEPEMSYFLRKRTML